jgi:hypothetical protein
MAAESALVPPSVAPAKIWVVTRDRQGQVLTFGHMKNALASASTTTAVDDILRKAMVLAGLDGTDAERPYIICDEGYLILDDALLNTYDRVAVVGRTSPLLTMDEAKDFLKPGVYVCVSCRCALTDTDSSRSVGTIAAIKRMRKGHGTRLWSHRGRERDTGGCLQEMPNESTCIRSKG